MTMMSLDWEAVPITVAHVTRVDPLHGRRKYQFLHGKSKRHHLLGRSKFHSTLVRHGRRSHLPTGRVIPVHLLPISLVLTDLVHPYGKVLGLKVVDEVWGDPAADHPLVDLVILDHLEEVMTVEVMAVEMMEEDRHAILEDLVAEVDHLDHLASVIDDLMMRLYISSVFSTVRV